MSRTSHSFSGIHPWAPIASPSVAPRTLFSRRNPTSPNPEGCFAAKPGKGRLLDLNEPVRALANKLVSSGILPSVAGRDAFHIAAAGVHRMDFLLTWNCKHIANPFFADRLHACFSQAGFHLPVICTPEQFLTDDNDSEDQSPENA